jgi:hypothetical protein
LARLFITFIIYIFLPAILNTYSQVKKYGNVMNVNVIVVQFVPQVLLKNCESILTELDLLLLYHFENMILNKLMVGITMLVYMV